MNRKNGVGRGKAEKWKSSRKRSNYRRIPEKIEKYITT